MQLFTLQLLFIATAVIGNAQAAVATLPSAQEFATSTDSLSNVDSLLTFPQEADRGSSSDSSISAVSSATNTNAGDTQIMPCSLSAPNKDECILNLMSQMLPQLTAGVPEYGLSSIDPYFYRRGIFRYNSDGIQGGLLIKDMKIHGISNLKINSFASNFTDNGFVVKVGLDGNELNADGQFKADVKFGGLRLAPKGPFNITVGDIHATILTDGILMNSDNNVKLQLKRLNANLSLGRSKIVANGIFSDHNLNAMIINLLNENLSEITRIGIPATRDQWAPILVEHINNFFAQVPIEKFLIP